MPSQIVAQKPEPLNLKASPKNHGGPKITAITTGTDVTHALMETSSTQSLGKDNANPIWSCMTHPATLCLAGLGLLSSISLWFGFTRQIIAPDCWMSRLEAGLL